MNQTFFGKYSLNNWNHRKHLKHCQCELIIWTVPNTTHKSLVLTEKTKVNIDLGHNSALDQKRSCDNENFSYESNQHTITANLTTIKHASLVLRDIDLLMLHAENAKWFWALSCNIRVG